MTLSNEKFCEYHLKVSKKIGFLVSNFKLFFETSKSTKKKSEKCSRLEKREKKFEQIWRKNFFLERNWKKSFFICESILQLFISLWSTTNKLEWSYCSASLDAQVTNDLAYLCVALVTLKSFMTLTLDRIKVIVFVEWFFFQNFFSTF